MHRRAFIASLASLAPILRSVQTVPRRKAGIGVFNVTPDAIAILRSLGITRVRITAYWRDWNATTGYNGAVVLRAIDSLKAAGIEPLVVVHTPPTGMSLADGIVAMPKFMAARATERHGVVWQIMNEMDGDDGFNGGWFSVKNLLVSQRTRGDRYGQLIAPTYDAIKKADPTATVVTGGIALEPTAFYAGLSSRTMKFDAVAVHCYGPPVASVFRSKSIAMRAVLGNMPLWCTEFGNRSTDDAAQAADLAAALDDNDRNHRYDRYYIYQLITDERGANDTYGLVHQDMRRRSALALLANRTAP